MPVSDRYLLLVKLVFILAFVASQVSFQAQELFEGQEAERRVAVLNRKLAGRDAIVNIGTMEIGGLPCGF